MWGSSSLFFFILLLRICTAAMKSLPLMLIHRLFRMIMSGSLETCPKEIRVVRTRSEGLSSLFPLGYFTKDRGNEALFTPPASLPIHTWMYLGCHSCISCRGTELSIATFIYVPVRLTEMYDKILGSQEIPGRHASIDSSWFRRCDCLHHPLPDLGKTMVFNKRYFILCFWEAKCFPSVWPRRDIKSYKCRQAARWLVARALATCL